MIDVKKIRSNPDLVVSALKKRNVDFDLPQFLSLDQTRRDLIFKSEQLKKNQNAASKEVGVKKTNNESCEELFADLKKLSNDIKILDEEIAECDQKIKNFLLSVPNLPHESVLPGEDSDDNVEIRKFGEPTTFSFEPKPHWEIGENLKILDFATGAKVSGSRFTFSKGLGAKLERAVVNFFLDIHAGFGYTEVFPPFIVNSASMTGTGQLPKFKEDMFHISGTDYYLIPTAEVPVTNMYRGDILSFESLPIYHAAYSACFRAEAGSAGRDTRGLIRQHQFNKVELVKIVAPENSYRELEELTDNAEQVLRLLGLPYRVVALCGGDLGFSSAKTYDIEVWMPSYGRYVEISSCSNFEDFQARRSNMRFKRNLESKTEFVHTLNGSGVAVGRCVAAIIENYQTEDGRVKIPDVLISYMGTEFID